MKLSIANVPQFESYSRRSVEAERQWAMNNGCIPETPEFGNQVAHPAYSLYATIAKIAEKREADAKSGGYSSIIRNHIPVGSTATTAKVAHSLGSAVSKTRRGAKGWSSPLSLHTRLTNRVKAYLPVSLHDKNSPPDTRRGLGLH